MLALTPLKKLVLLCSLLLIGSVARSQTKEVCFTLDDLPTVHYNNTDTAFQKSITNRLIASLQQYNIPAIGFVNEGKLYEKGQLQAGRVEHLKSWLQNGFELGNHSYSHSSYHRTSFQEYTQDIIQGSQVCGELVKRYNKRYNYYRHPYLHIGSSKEKHDSLTHFLEANGYTEAPVSIDNADYLFALAYHKAMKSQDSELMQKIGQDYLLHMEQKLSFYEGLSHKLFNRNIKHILLLHANALNAEYMDELAQMYRQRGYTFVSLEQALSDEAYKTPISSYGKWGMSWLSRWALSRKMGTETFKDDPLPPAYIEEMTAKQ